jgi:hypothetical protein
MVGGGGADDRDEPLPLLDPDDVMLVSGSSTIGGADESTAVYGRIGQAVVAVRIAVGNDPVVRASVGGGWFAAWWPSAKVGIVQGYDVTGKKIAEAK